jgi:hypothetical protein
MRKVTNKTVKPSSNCWKEPLLASLKKKKFETRSGISIRIAFEGRIRIWNKYSGAESTTME